MACSMEIGGVPGRIVGTVGGAVSLVDVSSVFFLVGGRVVSAVLHGRLEILCGKTDGKRKLNGSEWILFVGVARIHRQRDISVRPGNYLRNVPNDTASNWGGSLRSYEAVV